MALFGFLKDKDARNNESIICVLSFLLELAVNGDAHKGKDLDFRLYGILNSPEVSTKAIYGGCRPLIVDCKDGRKISDEFRRFIDNLWSYIVYDLDTSRISAMAMKQGSAPDTTLNQHMIYESVVTWRKDVVQYLYDRDFISDTVYESELAYEVKDLTI